MADAGRAPFAGGVGIFAFYALQPYLLELYGDPGAFGIAGSQRRSSRGPDGRRACLPLMRRVFVRRTHALIGASLIGIGCLALLGLTSNFWVALVLLVVWGMIFSVVVPIRQAYINGSSHPAAGHGAVVRQPHGLVRRSRGATGIGAGGGRLGIPSAYVVSAAIQLVSVPFLSWRGGRRRRRIASRPSERRGRPAQSTSKTPLNR